MNPQKVYGLIEIALETNPPEKSQLCTLCEIPGNRTGQNRSPIFLICGANNVVKHFGKVIEILHGCPFEG